MSSYENSSLTEIEAILDGLDEATAEQVFDATRAFAARALASVAASRADAAATGGGLPESWQDGGSGNVIAESGDAGSTALKVVAIEGQTADTFDVNGLASQWFWDNDGALSVNATAEQDYNLIDMGFAAAYANNLLNIFQNFNPFATVLRINKDGYLMIGNTAAPADGDISANECALWFDSTNGAAKIKFKGKSANGTVVQGEVALS